MKNVREKIKINITFISRDVKQFIGIKVYYNTITGIYNSDLLTEIRSIYE